jgi:hypothetical protein
LKEAHAATTLNDDVDLLALRRPDAKMDAALRLELGADREAAKRRDGTEDLRKRHDRFAKPGCDNSA